MSAPLPKLPNPPGASHDSEDHPLGHDPHDDAGHGGGDLHHDEAWLVSYADMVTLLMCLFVVLFSMSTLDKQKYEKLKESANKAFVNRPQVEVKGNVPGTTASPVPEGFREPHPSPLPSPAATATPTPEPTYQTESIRQEIADKLVKSGLDLRDVDLEQTVEGLKISLKASAFFASGSTDLTAKGQTFVAQVGQAIHHSQIQYRIRIEGHTDNAPIHTDRFPSNWELSAARAAMVARSFEDRAVDPGKLEAVGFGSSRPLVPNEDTRGIPNYENMGKNRRIVVQVIVANPYTWSHPSPKPEARVAPAVTNAIDNFRKAGLEPQSAPNLPAVLPAPAAQTAARGVAAAPGVANVPGVAIAPGVQAAPGVATAPAPIPPRIALPAPAPPAPPAPPVQDLTPARTASAVAPAFPSHPDPEGPPPVGTLRRPTH